MDYALIKEEVDTIKGSSFISLDTKTDVKLTGGKKNPLQGRVIKKTNGANVMIFAGTDQNGYENMVKRRMVEEGKDPDTFTVGARAWGTRIGQSPFIEHNGKKYLECIFMSPGKTVYYVDGVETDKSEIEGLPATADKSLEENAPAGNSTLENKVIIRTFALDSISTVRIKGKELA